MLQTIHTVFIQNDEPVQNCLFAMYHIAMQYSDEMGEDLKYGMPLITYKGKPFCYLWTDKKTKYPYYLMVRGDKINHPTLEQGDRKRMKILPINPHEDIPVEIVYAVFDMAKVLYMQ